MSAAAWFDQADALLYRIRQTQAEAIRKAAAMIADTAAQGGGLHYYNTGHCPNEPLHRAGGLLMINPISFSVNVSHQAAPKRRAEAEAQDRELAWRRAEEDARLAAERSNLLPGDSLIIVSVAGKTPGPVELALRARERGVKVIAITSLAYSKTVKSLHSSGRRLFEVADIVLDNCGVPGDAILEVEGVDAPICPTSGLAFCYLIWALTAEVVKELVARGLKPHVYRSINLEGGEEFNAAAEQEYLQTGL